MAQGRKYAALPDLDSAPDIYETSETQENDTKIKSPQSPAFTASSASDTEGASAPTSDVEGGVNGTSKSSRIDRHANRPARARDAFSGSRVDARGVDFSDRITGGRRSYRVPLGRKSRRRRREREGGGYVDEYGDFSDEDDEEESFAERLARLKREVEEMQAERERLAQEGGDKAVNGKLDEYKEAQDGISELGKILVTLQTKRRSSRLRKTDASAPSTLAQSQAVENGAVHEAGVKGLTTADVSLPNSEDIDRILSKAADFESRLALLETALGTSSANLDSNSQASQAMNKNIITTISTLESQFSTLSGTTLPSIDSMNSQIRQLTDDAARLEEARTAARAAQENLAARSPSSTLRGGERAGNDVGGSTPPAEPSSLPEDAEQAAKITALYKMLPTIDGVAPLLPAVLERLKSLRVLHADASVARENLAELGKTQAKMEDEITAWRDGLERAEKSFKEAEKAGTTNSSTLEAWVRDLEKRLKAFEA